MIKIKYTDTLELSKKQLGDLICTATEGGISYWACISGYKGNDSDLINRYSDEQVYRHIDYAMNEHTAIIFKDSDTGKKFDKLLTLKAIIEGLNIVAKDYPYTIQNIKNDMYDANDADRIIQCALFGKLIYG